MKRISLLICVAVAGFTGLGMLHPAPSQAAASFTIDEPADGGQVATNGDYALFSGTASADQYFGIFGYVDGRLLTCEDYFGNELNPESGEACWRIATVEGSGWSFAISKDLLDRLGIDLLGPHEVRFVMAVMNDVGDRTIVAEQAVDVEFVESIPTADPTPSAAAPADPGAEPGEPMVVAPDVVRELLGDPAAPTVLSSLRTVTDAVAAPAGILVAAAVTIVLLLLVGLPSTLLGQTLSENYDRVFGRATAAARRAAGILSSPALPRWVPLTFGLALATVLSSFVDPGFGWNLPSVRMLASVAIAFLVESVLGWVVIRAVLARTDPGLRPVPEFKFGSLAIILMAVVLSRLVGFEPGMVFGLVVGLAFGTSLAAAVDIRVKLIGLGWALTVGLVGWLGYSLVAGMTGWLPVFAAETLSAIAVSSLAALPVVLLPLSGLDGGAVFGWNRWAWAGAYLVGLLLFFVVLMPMPFSWGEVGTPLATWVGLYLGYAVLAAGVWAWFRFRSPKGAPPVVIEKT